MFRIVHTKKATGKTDFVYELDASVNQDTLLRLTDGAKITVRKFSRFDRLEKPVFTVKDEARGYILSGRIGDNTLFCSFKEGTLTYQECLESRLENVV